MAGLCGQVESMGVCLCESTGQTDYFYCKMKLPFLPVRAHPELCCMVVARLQ